MTRLIGPVLFFTLLTACGGGSSSGGGTSSSEDNVVTEMPVSPDTAITECGAFQGIVEGTAEDTVVAFKGLPYAKPPVGGLRWQPPAAADCVTDIMPATEFAAACAQLEQDGAVSSVAEDCLYLNVWTPADEFPSSEARPVLFFIHGGGNQRGSPSVEQLGVTLYDGARLAASSGAVVVTVGYRLGVLGFLAHPALSAENSDQRSGNYGLLDQMAALTWVQDNIAVFGGDPQRVTLFGESGGARDICSLVASPLANGLFAAAIMQSGGCRQKMLSSAEEDGQVISVAAGCNSENNAACLRSTSVEQLLNALGPEVSQGAFIGENIGPVVDDYVLPGSPDAVIASGAHNIVPMIIGANTDETGRMVLGSIEEAEYIALVRAQFGVVLGDRILARYPSSDYANPVAAYIALSTDSQFICPARRVAQSASLYSPDVFAYRFAKAFDSTVLQRFGAFHGIELFYIFQQVSVLESYPASVADQSIEDAMASYWSSFAANGNPNGGQGIESVEWERYSAATDTLLLIDSVTTQVVEPRASQCEFWGGIRNN